MAKKLVKAGTRTLVVNGFGDLTEVRNRLPNEEAAYAMDLIMHDQSDRPAGAVVERAFDIARLTFAHIKAHRMDTPFPFSKVYGDDGNDQ